MKIWQRHSLSFVVLGFVLLWVILYESSDPNSHWGSFFGNAIADWVGALVIILVTKYLYEQGSAESRPFRRHAKTPFQEFLAEHSLSLFLGFLTLVTCGVYLRMDPASRWGAVVGNILSQFVQLLALVLLTKKLFEQNSKETPGRRKKSSTMPRDNPGAPS